MYVLGIYQERHLCRPQSIFWWPNGRCGKQENLLAYQNEESKKLFNAKNVKDFVNKYQKFGKSILAKDLGETEAEYIAQ